MSANGLTDCSAEGVHVAHVLLRSLLQHGEPKSVQRGGGEALGGAAVAQRKEGGGVV